MPRRPPFAFRLYSRLKRCLSSLFSRRPSREYSSTHETVTHSLNLSLSSAQPFAFYAHNPADSPSLPYHAWAPIQCHDSLTSLEPFGMFSQAHNSVIYDASFVEDRTRSYEFLKNLLQETIIGAEFDSSHRYPPPRCHSGTQLAVLERCKAFVANCRGAKKIYWVVGWGGTGKSAIMQHIAEELPADASVFLSVDGRKDGARVIVTIAYQLATKYELYRQSLQSEMERDSTLLRAPLPVLFHKLIAQPFIRRRLVNPSNSFSVVIDGLDECDTPFMQQELLRLISQFCITYPTSPVVWFISSRPLPHLTSFFDDARVKPAYTKEEIIIDSNDTREDVQRYLRDELKRIKLVCPGDRCEQKWPTEPEIKKIATAAGGVIAYTSTALRYIDGPHSGDPASPLTDVLATVDVGCAQDVARSTNPLALLDASYQAVLMNVPADAIIIAKKLLLVSGHSQEKTCFYSRCNRLKLTEATAYEAMRHLYTDMKDPTPNKADKEPLEYFHRLFEGFLFRSGFFDNADDKAEQFKLQTALEIVQRVSGVDCLAVGESIDIGDHTRLIDGPDSHERISLTWPGDGCFIRTDGELRLGLYRDAMLDICDTLKSDHTRFRAGPNKDITLCRNLWRNLYLIYEL